MKAAAKLVVLFFVTLTMTLAPFWGIITNGGQNAFFEDWFADQEFTRDYAFEIEKDPSRDFVVLNFTDIQMKDLEDAGDTGALAWGTVDRLVKERKPDLITLTGDNAWQFLAYNDLIRQLDSYGIPWAPVMGNHDGQGTPSEFWCAYNLAKAKNCLFKFGPKDMGYGNYIINITEDGEIIHTMFMMDTHSNIEEDNVNGKKDSGYDNIWENQMEWYKWAVKGIEAIQGKTVESSVFIHIPMYEYKLAWEEATDGNGNFIGEYADTSFGVKHEDVCCAPENNGFFDILKEYGSTKNVLCGHEHINDFSILYQGIRLTYTLKTGSGCYWEPELSGGTTFTIASDGSAQVQHHFVDPETVR